MNEDEPFGRQPRPVRVTLTGSGEDIDYWFQVFKRRVESMGDNIVQKHRNVFTIYPHAVND
jgi:hypothetical protein